MRYGSGAGGVVRSLWCTVQYGRNIVASVDKNSKRMQEKDRQVEVSPLLLTSGVVKLWEVLLQEVC
jgi:hypothetical protein